MSTNVLDEAIFTGRTVAFLQIESNAFVPAELFNKLDHPCCTEFGDLFAMARCQAWQRIGTGDTGQQVMNVVRTELFATFIRFVLALNEATA